MLINSIFHYFSHSPYREDGFNIGSLLKIKSVQPNHYRKYTCRVEIGNSEHRLEMVAHIRSKPIPPISSPSYILPLILLAIGAVATIVLSIAGIKYMVDYASLVQRRKRKLNEMMDSTESIHIREVV